MLRPCKGRRIPPCHRHRCILLCQPCRLYQHPDLHAQRQAEQGHFRSILVGGSGYAMVYARLTSDSCYNAFSRVDMRVQVQIPGTVESYCVDERGSKMEATEEHWLETYLCSVLRAYSYADNGSGDTIKRIIGVRRFNPVTSTDQEQRFLDAAERLFFSGMFTMCFFQGLH
jgi:hypothetical protein